MEPNFESYSLAQLTDAKRVIDKEKYPERYEKVVALIEKRESEEAESIPEKSPNAKPLHTPLQIFFGSYWGGPLYTLYAIRKNFLALDNEKGAADSLKYGSAFLLLLLVIIPFIPDNYPNIIGPVIYCLLGKVIVEKYHLKKNEINQSADYVYESNWKILGLGLCTLIVFLVVISALIMGLSYIGL